MKILKQPKMCSQLPTAQKFAIVGADPVGLLIDYPLKQGVAGAITFFFQSIPKTLSWQSWQRPEILCSFSLSLFLNSVIFIPHIVQIISLILSLHWGNIFLIWFILYFSYLLFQLIKNSHVHTIAHIKYANVANILAVLLSSLKPGYFHRRNYLDNPPA